uniref:Uncharacterized protein n=1 Tax=Lactuca sativa TaxID=4236 RepID=A0A9R1UHH7_LACSA|nr:hypothetical protein LSAT_V11C900506410 [Lactuca sativa]
MKTKVNEQKRKKQMKGIHLGNEKFGLQRKDYCRKMALKTINIREESEEQNVWVAYFNLENEYGSPPEDVVFLFKKYLEFEKS